ncbi:MAG: amidohydrolase family protein [Flavisolibacter sp.]|nr:amidohydrolase family protein [Flavisolibacter sp.]MBD0287400.1 amidohydrolase family protein [Flavisolibacter sp.]MBD0297004.1 amidohydrolase family protein [Flavisolibacter sp.]
MKQILLIIFLFSVTACTAQESVGTKDKEIVFRSVNVIPMDKESVLQNRVVVVKNGKITAIGAPEKTKWSKDALVIDAKGKYLMPGLAEMHAHVPPVDDLEPMKEVLLLFAANGVTTIRGMLGHPRHLELRSKIQSGEILGPRFFTSGPSFNGQSTPTPEKAIPMVRQQKEAGYDFLKLHPGLTKETFAALAQTAKEVGIPFAGHVSFDVGIWRAIEAGYATIDHLDGFVESLVPGIEDIGEQKMGLFALFVGDQADTTRIPKLITGLRDHNIWVVPTQSLAERWFSPGRSVEVLRNEPEMIYMAPNTVNNWVNTKTNLLNNPAYNSAAVNRFIQLRRKLIYECNKNGVGLLLGSDAPQVFDVPGFSVHHELRYLVDAGLSPYEALRTGTVNVARFYRQPDWGVIKEGAVADLILLNGNPLANIDETRNIEGVLLNGRWLSKNWIKDQLKSLEKK